MTGWHLDDNTLRRYVERTDSLAVSPPGKVVACGMPGSVFSVSASADGRMIATASEDSPVLLWRLAAQ